MSKLCKDCKHFSEFNVDGFTDSFCTRPTGELDLVYGKPLLNVNVPDNERRYGGCGPEGKHFEQNPSFFVKFLKRCKGVRSPFI